MNIPLVDLKVQHNSIRAETDATSGRVLEQGQFILGFEVKAIEEKMAKYCGTKYSVGAISGTDALHVALLACGIKSGDEVITTLLTFIATAGSISKCGARPALAGIDPRIYNMEPERIERYVRSRQIASHQSPITSHCRPPCTPIRPDCRHGTHT